MRKRFVSSIVAGIAVVAAPFIASRAAAGHGAKYPPVLAIEPQPFVVIPEVPAVTYAPQLPFDVFQYRGRYYTWRDGWYVTNQAGKPWTLVKGNRVPQPILLVPAQYYKRLPPGQAKKLYRTGPPGHWKHPHDRDHDHDDD